MKNQRGFGLIVYAVAALAIVAALSAIAWAIHNAGVKSERAVWQQREAKINVETAIKIDAANKRIQEKEREIAVLLTDASEWYQAKITEKENALNTALNSLRDGTGRLFVNATCPAAGGDPATAAPAAAGGRDGSTRAELSRADSEFLLRLGAEADAVVLQLTACQAVVRADRGER